MNGTTTGHIGKIDDVREFQSVVTKHCVDDSYQNAVHVRCEPNFAAVHIFFLAVFQNVFRCQVFLSELADSRVDLEEEYLAPEDVLKHRRSEEHTSELQSLAYLVCRLLL